jgi:mono/diheme cytochrome c family protein
MATRQPPPSQNDHRLPWRTPGSWWLWCLVIGVVCLVFGVWRFVVREDQTPNVVREDSTPNAVREDQTPNTKHTTPITKQDEPARPFLAHHCQGCHAGDKPKGKFRLAALTQDFNDKANREWWLAVSEQVRSGAMPPKGKPRPPEKDVTALTDWIRERVETAESARIANQGRVPIRRLNRAEYENTVRDLLGVDVELKDVLPEDTPVNGFDNAAEALHVSSFLMEQYLEAADKVLDASIVNGPKPWMIKKRFDVKDEKSVRPKGSVYRHLEDSVAIFSSWVSANIQVTLWQFFSHFRGNYRFRISAYAFQTDKPVTFHVTAGTMKAVTEERIVGYHDVPPGKPTVIEFVEKLEPRNTVRFVVDNLGVIPPVVEKIGAENYKGPGLAIQWVEIEGPLHETWPPPSHRRLFGDLKQAPAPTAEDKARREVVSEEPLADAERLLRAFLRRAFRRAVTDEDVKPFLARVKAKLDAKFSFEQAMRVGYKAVLVSPHFLFLREKPGKLDDFALANRLSYFLWSSMPDEELLALAEKGELHQPDTLRAQVERLLKDARAAAFTQNFAGQWLGLRNIDATAPDPTLYPEYDDVLKVAMVKEALLFFDVVLKEDLSLTNFVSSDFTMLNGRLARHYGIPGVTGQEFKKVKLPPGCHRGGVLTMAAVLKVTANGTTTSPILRGAWVLDRILGTPPPKPTVDVEAVEPDIRGARTIREQLAKHRDLAECASCHKKIDPPGFALESFDVIGGWRDYYRSVGKGEPAVVNGRTMRYKKGPAVDPADVMPNGSKFANVDEFKQLLLKDRDQLARALTEKLLTYATGAAPAKSDRAEIDAIVGKVRDRKFGFRSLVHEVVQSKVFQTK